MLEVDFVPHTQLVHHTLRCEVIVAREYNDALQAHRPGNREGLATELGPDSLAPAVACHDPSNLDLAMAAYEAVPDQPPAVATAVL
jgi:hypothetical protein